MVPTYGLLDGNVMMSWWTAVQHMVPTLGLLDATMRCLCDIALMVVQAVLMIDLARCADITLLLAKRRPTSWH